MGLCAALAVHVIDEAVTDQLAVYNSAVQVIRERYPLILLPTLTFSIFLSLLIFAVIVLVGLSVLVWRGKWAMRPISCAFAGVMLTNGLMHIAHSLFTQKFMSGVYSSPLLLAASIHLIVATRAHKHSPKSRNDQPA